MITKIIINNFKKLENIAFSVSQSLVIIGPNNSGKSTIFQALCLWEIGVTNYLVALKKNDLNRAGFVVINRKDLLNSPISDARFLWKNKKVTIHSAGNTTQHVKLEVEIQGQNDGTDWYCKVEFTFTNAESFTCRIVSGKDEIKYLKNLYENGNGVHFGFLQPMSGISSIEDKLQQGAIDRRLGEGKTAEVLRNICYEVLYPEINKTNSEKNWKKLCDAIKSMFGADLQKPEFIKIDGTIQLEYTENGIRYDISSGGRGFQQMLLLLAYMFASPNTILLLDEPDAHLEVIRQRQAFQLINQLSSENNTQIIIVSHSEVVLEEAASGASKVVALVENKTIELNKATNNQSLGFIKKTLTKIGWENYYLANQKKYVLYLEGSTDLQMLQQFATKLKHKVASLLQSPNVQYTSDNVPNTAVQNFTPLKAFFPDLKGLALFDRIDKNIDDIKPLKIVYWKRRELENYFASPALLLKFATEFHQQHKHLKPAFLVESMQNAINEYTLPAYLKNLENTWWKDAKLSDEWLDLIFPEFYKRLDLPQDYYKRDYYQLISLLSVDEIDNEITEKLNLIYEVIK